MSALDPLYSVWCDRCGRAYLGRADDLTSSDSSCFVCSNHEIRSSRVPDAEDMATSQRLLSMDPREHSARLALRSARLRHRSDMLLCEAKAALAAARQWAA
jgi:hypothetical protein